MMIKLDRFQLMSLLLALGVVVSGAVGASHFLGARPGKQTLTGYVFDRQKHESEARLAEITRRFQQGVAMLQARQYEFAATAFHRVLELDPEVVEAHVNLGYALLGMGNAKAARDFFDGATVMRPMQANAYYGLGLAYQQLGQPEGALGAMNTYVHLTLPDDPHRARAQEIVNQLRRQLSAMP